MKQSLKKSSRTVMNSFPKRFYPASQKLKYGWKKMYFLLMILFFISIVLTENSKACITLCIRDSNSFICSFSYDFDTCLAYVTINKRNLTKSSLFYIEEDEPVTWTSKYGSITFNQIGNQLPICGMNEKGLAVTLMWLDGTEYPEKDDRKALTELQWVQYQLDNSASIQEVIESNSKIRISRTSIVPLHYFIIDKYAHSAVIEFLNREMVVYKNDQLPLEVLPNTTYKDILNSYFQSKGEYPDNTDNSNDLLRFNKTVKMIQEFDKQHSTDIIKYSFDVLESVKCSNTRWNIVFDIKREQIYYRTRENPQVRTINIDDFNYDCDSPQKIIDINQPIIAYSCDFGHLILI